MSILNAAGSTTSSAKEFAREFLQKNNIMVLASSSLKGELHAASVAYCIDEKFNFCFLTTIHSTKAKNLLEHKNAAFTIGFGPNPIVIQGGGIVTLLNDIKTIEAGFILKNRPHPWPLLTLSQKDICAFEITPTWMTMLNLESKEYPELASAEFYKII